MKKIICVFAALLLVLSLCACGYTEKLVTTLDSAMSTAEDFESLLQNEQSRIDSIDSFESENTAEEPEAIEEDGSYFSKDEVALYIHTYGKLPQNFITKAEAKKLGWEGGSVEEFAPGKAIGGDSFGNYEGLLPQTEGRKYTECDIDTNGKSSRGAKRIVFSSDGLVYYTEDHYESFELLYGGSE
jgi:ribonuclease T1